MEPTKDLCDFVYGEHEQTWSDVARWETVRERWQRRCGLPAGHEGAHLIKSFLIESAREPLNPGQKE